MYFLLFLIKTAQKKVDVLDLDIHSNQIYKFFNSDLLIIKIEWI
jgi:hypothetical protein